MPCCTQEAKRFTTTANLAAFVINLALLLLQQPYFVNLTCIMVWLEDPLCGDGAHRGVLEEEDEQAAQELAEQYTVEPDVQVGGS